MLNFKKEKTINQKFDEKRRWEIIQDYQDKS